MAKQHAKAAAKRILNQITEWNTNHPIGTPVTYCRVQGGERRQTTTRSEAFLADSGEPVIFLDGVSGYYSLDHVEAM